MFNNPPHHVRWIFLFSLLIVFTQLHHYTEVHMLTHEQFDRERRYCAGIAIAKAALIRGIINDTQYLSITTKLLYKYRPLIGGLAA